MDVELFDSDMENQQFQAERLRTKRGAPACTGIPGLDILGACGEEKRAALPGSVVVGNIRDVGTGKRSYYSSTLLSNLEHLREIIENLKEKRGAPACTGIPALDILGGGCVEAKRAIPGVDIVGQIRNGKRAAPACTGIPGLDILNSCGDVKRAPEAPIFELAENVREAKEKRACTGIPMLDILNSSCREAKRSSKFPHLELLHSLHESAKKRGAPACTGIPGLDILGTCG